MQLTKMNQLYIDKCFSVLLIAFFLVLAAGNCFADVQKVSLRLQWKHQFEFAGFYAAKELGYYRDAGLVVEILEYESDVDVVAEVTSGKVDFGLRSSDLIEMGMQGKPVMILANYFKRSPLALATQPDIRFPSDLVGKKLMSSKHDFESANYTQMFNTFKVDPEQIERVPPSFDMHDFIDKKVDAVSIFLSNEPYWLKKEGVPYNVIDPNNYGVELYDGNLFTSQRFAKTNPELLDAFISASNRGWDYALNHQEEIVDLILKQYNSQNKSREHLLFEARQIVRIVQPKTYPIGSIDLNRISRIGQLFTEVGMVEQGKSAPFSSFVYISDQPQIELTAEEARYVRAHRKVLIAMMPDFPPFSFASHDYLEGFEHDLLALISEKTGLIFEPVRGIWSKGFRAFKAKKVDMISSISYQEDRLPFTLYSTPYYEIPVMVYVRDDFGKYEGLDSLAGKKVGIIKDVFYADELRELDAFDLVVYDTYHELTKDLAYGRVDALVQNLTNTNALIKKHGYTNLRIAGELRLPSISAEDLRFGIRSDEPILHSIIQKAMDDITPVERMRLVDKWLGRDILAVDYKKAIDMLEPLQLTEREAEYLQQKKVLRVSNEPAWPPYDFVKDGQAAGYSVDLVRILARQLNVEVEFVEAKPWGELVEMFCRGEIDILHPADRSEKIRGCGQFSQPIIRDITNFVTRSDFGPVESLEDLHGTTIATPKGWEQTEYLQKNHGDKFKFHLTGNTLEAIEAVRSGKADFAADYGNVLRYLINKNHYVGLKIQGVWDVKSGVNDLYIATPKDQPTLLRLINRAIGSIPPSVLVSLSNRWFGAMEAGAQTPAVEWSEAEAKYLKRKKQIKFCVDPDWLPIEGIDENGKHVGIGADILKKVAKNSGLNLQLVPTDSWSESLSMAQQGQCDFLALAMKTPERQEYLSFSRPYVSFPFVVATRNTAIYIDDMASLKGKKIAMLKDYASVEMFGIDHPEVDIVLVDSRLDGLRKVGDAEVFGYVDALPPLAAAIRKEGFTEIRIAGKIDKEWELSIATRKDEPLLLGIMQKALDTVAADEIQSIYNKWLAIRYEDRIDYSLLYKFIAGFVLIAVLGGVRHYELYRIKQTIEEKKSTIATGLRKVFLAGREYG